jgi:hypothetical protein
VVLGIWSEYARTYLLVVGGLSTVAFALPLFLVPLRWARVLRWELPANANLAIYFGRCVGALALILAALAFRAALTGVGLEYTFQVIIAAAALMVVVHAWGALRRIQPLTETVEIVFWAALVALGVLFYPV